MATLKAAAKGGFLTQKQVIDLLYSRSMRVLRGQENENIAALMGHYRTAQNEIVAQLVTKYGDTAGWTLQQWEDSGRLRSLLQSVEQILTTLQTAVEGEIGKASQVQFYGSYDQTSWALDQATPPNRPVRFMRPPEDAVRVLSNTPYKGAMFSQRIGMITNAMASDIRDELTQSLIQGEGMADAAARIKDIIGISRVKDPRSYAYRARVIARSEIMRSQNLARDFTYEQNKDVVEDTEWLVTPDDRLCPWCMRREGLTDKEIEEAPQEAGGKEDPWGNSTDAPLHPNCRCTKIPKLTSWKNLIGLDMPESLNNDYRGIRNEDGDWEIAPVEKFDTWLEQKTGQLADLEDA